MDLEEFATFLKAYDGNMLMNLPPAVLDKLESDRRNTILPTSFAALRALIKRQVATTAAWKAAPEAREAELK